MTTNQQALKARAGMRTYGLERANGFTLIEMLVTLTLFAMVMSALVGGLHAGIRAWKTVRAHQVRSAQIERALRVINSDLRGLAIVSEEEPPLVEKSPGQGWEGLSFTAVDTRRRQRAGLGTVWTRVDYTLRLNKEGDAHDLVRASIPYISAQPVNGARREDVLIEKVRKIGFEYLHKGGRVPVWESPKKLPAGIDVFIEMASGGHVSETIWIPCGALGAWE